MTRFEEEGFDPSLFRKNLLLFRQNLRRGLGLPRRPVRLLRERLILRRLPEEEAPRRAVRRVVYDSEGRVVGEEVVGPLSLTPASTPATTTEASSLGPREATARHAHTPPAPSPGPEERIEKTRNVIQQLIEARREYGILWNIRRAVKAAVEETQREMEIERRKRELELKAYEERLKREREEGERRGRGLHY